MIKRKEYYDPWEEPEELSDDLDDFLREIYADTGYDDQDLEGMLEEWENDES